MLPPLPKGPEAPPAARCVVARARAGRSCIASAFEAQQKLIGHGDGRSGLAIIRDRYADFGPTLACQKPWQCHGIRVAKETVSQPG